MTDNIKGSGFKHQRGGSVGPEQWLRRPTSVNSFDEVLPTDIPIPFKEVIQGGTIDLVVSDGTVQSIDETITLSQEQPLAVDDAYVSVVSESIDLVQEHNLSADDVSVESYSDSVSLEIEHVLSVFDASVSCYPDEIGIEQLHELVANDGYSQQIGEAIDIEQEHYLDVADSVVSQSAEAVTLAIAGEQVLSVDDGFSEQLAEDVGLVITGEVPPAVVITKGRSKRKPWWYVYQVPEKLPEVKPISIELNVFDGFIDIVGESIDLKQKKVISIVPNNKIIKIHSSKKIVIEHINIKRRIEEEIILLAA